jgi:hypothetical protein
MATGTTIGMLMASRRIAVFTATAALLGLLGEAAYCWSRPTAFFDTMAYVAIVEGGGNDFAVAEAECAAQVPGPWSACAEVASMPMTRQVEAYSAADFAQYLRFYTVKPLYTGLAAGLHRWFRVDAFVGLRMISVSSFVLIGVVCWAWLREHLPVAVAPIAAFWMMAMEPVLGLGKDLLPDGLSTALVLLGVYLLLYRSPKWMGASALGLALLVRPDNMLLLLCLGVVWLGRGEKDERRRLMKVGGFAVGCVAVSLVLGRLTGAVSWAVLFRRSFFELIPPERFAQAHVSLREYGHVLASNGVRTVMFCLPVAALLATFVLLGRRVATLRMLVGASAAAVILRVVRYPGVEERYYVWFLLVCAIAAACVMAESTKDLAGSDEAYTMVQDHKQRAL